MKMMPTSLTKMVSMTTLSMSMATKTFFSFFLLFQQDMEVSRMETDEKCIYVCERCGRTAEEYTEVCSVCLCEDIAVEPIEEVVE